MKYRMRLAVLGVVLLAILIGCGSDQEFRDVKIVGDYLGQHTDMGDVAYFDAGPLAEGTAVHFPDRDSAFWVKEGVIYAVNENAKTLAPDLERAPTEIDYETVIKAAQSWKKEP